LVPLLEGFTVLGRMLTWAVLRLEIVGVRMLLVLSLLRGVNDLLLLLSVEKFLGPLFGFFSLLLFLLWGLLFFVWNISLLVLLLFVILIGFVVNFVLLLLALLVGGCAALE
jgi:hypothetical protein